MSESLNFAVLRQVPVVFLCENNFYSVQSPLFTRQPERDLCRWAEGYGLPAVRADGMNVLAVYGAVRDAVERARRGDGPTFVELPLYRFRAHGGAGDDSQTGYRDEAERRAWEPYCPVAMFETYLTGAGQLDAGERDAMEAEIAAEIADAFTFALASPHPDAADLHRHVYAP